MARQTLFNKDNFLEFTPGKNLPEVSQKLDSIRTYQFEVHFLGLDNLGLPGPRFPNDLTLAAKQVSQIGMMVEDIEVNRVSEKFYYPGKATPEELVITFDNLYKSKTANDLWRWFKLIHDPITGEQTKSLDYPGGGHFKINRAEIIQLDNKNQPFLTIDLFGVYPKSWKSAEHNYSTNDFHTVEMTFRYDLMRVNDVNSTSNE